jgi:formate-dependent nitrite reductase membrane component NrfD
MDSAALIKRSKINLTINLILGAALLIAGIIVQTGDIQILENNRILTALSFIPLAIAIAYGVKIRQVKRQPDKFAEEYDERITAARDRADAMSMRIIRYALWLGFLAYTFAKSAEVFESFTWWFITGLSLAAVLLPAFFMGNVNRKYKPDSANE